MSKGHGPLPVLLLVRYLMFGFGIYMTHLLACGFRFRTHEHGKCDAVCVG